MCQYWPIIKMFVGFYLNLDIDGTEVTKYVIYRYSPYLLTQAVQISIQLLIHILCIEIKSSTGLMEFHVTTSKEVSSLQYLPNYINGSEN